MWNRETHVPGPASFITLPEQDGIEAHERLAVDDFEPNLLLDVLLRKMRLENDAALARELQVHEKIIAMLRDGKLSISVSMLVFVHRITGIGLDELCDAMRSDAMRKGPASPV
jgi:hypothetical protein